MWAKRSIKVVVSSVWFAVQRIGRLISLRNRRRSELIILYYHGVRQAGVAAFRKQIEAIVAYGDVVDADYVGESYGRPKVAITFDDAFMSVIDNALPELAARRLPCTIFVPTGCLGARPKWPMEGNSLDSSEVIANANILNDLANKGVCLGAHSRSHPRLTRIGLDDARVEISGSKADVERLSDRPADLFAFPYGDFDSEILHLCKEAGYRFVFSIGPGSVDPRDTTMLRPRVAVDPFDSGVEFWFKLRGAYNWMATSSSIKTWIFGTKSKLVSQPK